MLILCLSLVLFSVSSVYIERNTDYAVDSIDLSDHIQTTHPFQTATNSIKYKAEQMFKEIPIFGAHLVIEQEQEDDSIKTPVFGKYFKKAEIAHHIKNTVPEINENDAMAIGMNALNISSDNLFGKSIKKLYIYHHTDIPYLCWFIRFSYSNNKYEIYQPLIIIDANQGEILKMNNNPLPTAINYKACGDGGNAKIGYYRYCDHEDKPSLNISSSQFLSNNNVEMYDNKNNYYFNKENAQLITCQASSITTNNECFITDYMVHEGYCVCDAYSFINVVFDLYDKWLNGTIPIADNFLPLKAYLHVGESWANANWDGINGAVNFGDGSASLYPPTVLDITAHEIGHAFVDKTAHLINSGESGAISEAYSDLIGEVAEYYFFGTNDWMIGSEMMKYGGGIRYMNDPRLDGISIDEYSQYYNTLNVHYASGLYNKVFYVLHTSYFWSMKQLFKVFSYAARYYWWPDSSFNEGVCGAIEALHDLYGNNVTQLMIMENGLVLSFLSVGLECLSSTNMTQPRQGIPCGEGNDNKYCYYQDITPVSHTITEFVTPLIAQHDGYLATHIDIYYTVNGLYDCIDPIITFKYEQIDYEYFGNYVDIFNDENNKIVRCGGGGIIDDMRYNHNECGVFVDCITDHNLGQSKISVGATYKISITESQSVHAKCTSNHLLSLNAILILKCSGDLTALPTISPTKEPTNVPTIPTVIPTKYPTSNPTQPTLSPTIYPTQYILQPTLNPTLKPTTMPTPNASIYEMLDGQVTCDSLTLGDLKVKNDSIFLLFRLNENNDFGYYVQFAACNSTFDVVLSVYDMELSLIKEVDDSGGCSSTLHPILLLDPVYSGDYILQIASYKGLSGGAWRMGVNCLDYDEILNGNDNQIGNNGILCGYNRYCYDVDLNITAKNETFVFTQQIQHNKTGNEHAMEYEVYLVANGEYNCYLPSITFEYERIDHYYRDQFIDVYNNEDVLIQRCGADHIDNKCKVLDECFSDNYLEWDVIKNNGESYLISIVNSNNIEPFCNEFHSYTINATLTVQCLPLNSTFTPTMKPTLNPTIYPTSYPTGTIIPTTTSPSFIPTLLPTVNPSIIPTLNPSPNPTIIPTLPVLSMTTISTNDSKFKKKKSQITSVVLITVAFIGLILIIFGVFVYVYKVKGKMAQQQNETYIKDSVQMIHTSDTTPGSQSVVSMSKTQNSQ